MKYPNLNFNSFAKQAILKFSVLFFIVFGLANHSFSQIQLEQEVKVTDSVMFFNKQQVPLTYTANSTTGYDYLYGNALTPHGD